MNYTKGGWPIGKTNHNLRTIVGNTSLAKALLIRLEGRWPEKSFAIEDQDTCQRFFLQNEKITLTDYRIIRMYIEGWVDGMRE